MSGLAHSRATCNQWLYDDESGHPTRICVEARFTEHDHDNARSLDHVRVYEPDAEPGDVSPAQAARMLALGLIYEHDDGTFWLRPGVEWAAALAGCVE